MTPLDRAALVALLERVVTTSEVAAMAGVTKAAVSNWTTRKTAFTAAFPRPVAVVQDYPLYDADEITAWLDSRRAGLR